MLDLEPIKTRLATATPGPWAADVYNGGTQALVMVDAGIQPHVAHLNDGSCATLCGNGPANAELIGHAPGDLAALVAEVERLRAVLEEMCTCAYGGTNPACDALGHT